MTRAAHKRPLLARAIAAGALACLLGMLVAVAHPGAADSAPPRVVILGQTNSSPPASCPGKIVNNVEVVPCRVEGHVTGFQAIAGGVPKPYVAPFTGKIVAWSITLARPSRVDSDKTTNEIGFFNDFLGKPSQARISVLQHIRKSSNPPRFRLARQSPVQTLNPYFGSTVTFALAHPLPVFQGQVVALTIPTWAPMFAFNVSDDNTWRGSRPNGKCSSKKDIQEGNPQQKLRSTRAYGCYYSNARLLYKAIVVKKP